MKIVIKRIALRQTYTIGHLFINGTYFCDTLEDTVRSGVKVPAETAIPSGSYQVIINYSERFKCSMPYVLNVKNFSGIRIHPGNTDADTAGCILVGENKIVGRLTNSRFWYCKLCAQLFASLSKKEVINLSIIE